MLGDVSPQELHLVTSGVQYPGRDHVDKLYITRWDGRRHTELDFSQVLRVELVLLGTDPMVAVDSVEHPVSMWVEGSSVYVDLSMYALDEATYLTQMVVYDLEHPRGQVLVDNKDTVYQVDVRRVNAVGGTPPPLLTYVLEAPLDGSTYARRNGAWAPISGAVGGSGVTYVQDSAPVGASEAETWWNPLTLQLKVFHIDKFEPVSPDGGHF